MTTPAKIGDVVAVEWDDAWCDQGETVPVDFRSSTPVTTYGILLRKGSIVTVAAEVMPDNQYRASTHIPKGMVTRIRKLAEGEG